MKSNKCVRIYSNVSERDYQRLQSICAMYGFNSIYQLLQVLLHCFLRYADQGAQQDPEEYSMAKEIEDMFDDLMDQETRPKYFATYRGQKNTQ